MLAAIPYNSGTHIKYFAKGKEVYGGHYGYLIHISAQHVGAFNIIMMENLEKWHRGAKSCKPWIKFT